MLEKGIRGRIFHELHTFTKLNNKSMNNYNEKKKLSSYIQYLDANNLYG